VSRGPQRICTPAKAGDAEILPMMSSVSEDDVRAEEGAPGAARVEGMEEAAESMGRRALRSDMLRALGLLVSLIMLLLLMSLLLWVGRVVLLRNGWLEEGCWARNSAQAAESVHCLRITPSTPSMWAKLWATGNGSRRAMRLDVAMRAARDLRSLADRKSALAHYR